MGKPVETLTARVLLLQVLAHALIFAAPNVGNFAERALLAPDTAATAALGLSWTAFSLLYAFTTNVVSVCPLIVGRCSGDRDDRGARAAAGQALLLAGGGGAVGLAVAVAAGAVAAVTVGPARGAALFLATQCLALGPLLGAKALTGYFAGTMRVGPRLLAAVSVAPVAVHLALAWLLTGLLPWSVAGAGLARLGAALAAVAAALAIARAEFGCLVGLVRRVDRVLLWAMITEGSVLGLQQVVAGLMVLLLYFMAARSGATTLAALTLTHSGVYPLLFCFAWGSSQAVATAAAQAVGRGDARELARVTRLCLGLSVVLAFALPWGAFAAYGRPTLAWLVGGNPAGGAVLAASVQLMGWLAVFFVFDFAINFLSALLKAANEQAYLLKCTAAAAAGFGLLLFALPPRPDGAWLMGTFLTAQVAWAVLLLIRVASRWPGSTGRPGLAAPALGVRGNATRGAPARTGVADFKLTTAPCPPLPGGRTRARAGAGDREVANEEPAGRLPERAGGQGRGDARGRGAGSRRPFPGLIIVPTRPTPEEHAMDPLQPNTALLSPALRALALSLLIETGGPLLNRASEASPVPAGQGELWQALRYKCGELSALVLRANDPGEATAYVLDYLPKHFQYAFELCGRKRPPVLADFEAGRQAVSRDGGHDADPAKP